MKIVQMSQSGCLVNPGVGLAQGLVVLRHSVSGLERCACFLAGAQQGSAAAEESCVPLTQMRSAPLHRMPQPLAGLTESLHESSLHPASKPSERQLHAFDRLRADELRRETPGTALLGQVS